jgi:hypothetical protein
MHGKSMTVESIKKVKTYAGARVVFRNVDLQT